MSVALKGKNGGQEIYCIDTAMIALERELRAHDCQVAQELGQWQEPLEDRQLAASRHAELQAFKERARNAVMERRAREAAMAEATMAKPAIHDGGYLAESCNDYPCHQE